MSYTVVFDGASADVVEDYLLDGYFEESGLDKSDIMARFINEDQALERAERITRDAQSME